MRKGRERGRYGRRPSENRGVRGEPGGAPFGELLKKGKRREGRFWKKKKWKDYFRRLTSYGVFIDEAVNDENSDESEVGAGVLILEDDAEYLCRLTCAI